MSLIALLVVHVVFYVHWWNTESIATLLYSETVTSQHSIIQGQWLNNFANGTGTLTYADGDKYVGTWKDGKKSESGELYYTNGDKFR